MKIILTFMFLSRSDSARTTIKLRVKVRKTSEVLFPALQLIKI